ncbi:MAG TPA: CGNR zinc finger domain-containing protein [Solirubrobacterales bacterium]|nr:CGNR zinc finger domain-containing protein [Solirubrobacterales bacterium]
MSRENLKASLEPEADLLVSFVNTRDIEEQTDSIADPEALRSWVAEQTGERLPPLDEDGLRRIRALRESMRALMRANNGATGGKENLRSLREAAEDSRYRLQVSADGQLTLTPTRSDLAAFEGKLLLAIEHLQCHDAWPRLKACTNEGCQWAFYDTTRNRSRTWCSMEVCGNRDKTRRYRERRSGD